MPPTAGPWRLLRAGSLNGVRSASGRFTAGLPGSTATGRLNTALPGPSDSHRRLPSSAAASSGAMDDTQRLAVAKAYVEASNAHDIERIFSMMAPGVAYRSTGVGAHNGASAIRLMNTSFFGDYPNVHWDTRDWHAIVSGGLYGVEFSFTIILVAGETQTGVERVFVDDSGAIVRVEVERGPAAYCIFKWPLSSWFSIENAEIMGNCR